MTYLKTDAFMIHWGCFFDHILTLHLKKKHVTSIIDSSLKSPQKASWKDCPWACELSVSIMTKLMVPSDTQLCGFKFYNPCKSQDTLQNLLNTFAKKLATKHQLSCQELCCGQNSYLESLSGTKTSHDHVQGSLLPTMIVWWCSLQVMGE